MIKRIRVEGVTKLFGSTAALRGVSAVFEAGSISFLEGGNGAGKSTLLAIMGTVLKASRGVVQYGELGLDRRMVRAQLGWVAHDSHCYRDLTAQENVALAARMYGMEPSAAWSSVASRLDIVGFANRRVGTLSRGQKQRVAIARALVHRPGVLLMDEPWSGLDQRACSRLVELLGEERDRGAIVIAVSHVAEHAARLGARRLRLERGVILA